MTFKLRATTHLMIMMAVSISTSPFEHLSTISKFISRLRRRSTKDMPKQESQESVSTETRAPLTPSPLPFVLPEHQAALSNLGWTTITFPQAPPITDQACDVPAPGVHPLQKAYEGLLTASQVFFDLPPGEKRKWKHRLGSEEGWSCIAGEKEFITLRSLEYCPEVLREPAKLYWDLMGAHLENTLGRIATSLDIPFSDDPSQGLKKFVGPCRIMQETDEQKTATMLRLFRYEGWEPKIVAEPHADLGLLSVVVGNVPGLEVWDGAKWFEIEKELERTEMKGASLLSGRQLERLSNGRYPAGGHRVVSYGDPEEHKKGNKRYRFSIVFVLRAHEPVTINSSDLETRITGRWQESADELTAGELYAKIRGAHFNINIGLEEREKQRKTTRALQGQSTSKYIS